MLFAPRFVSGLTMVAFLSNFVYGSEAPSPTPQSKPGTTPLAFNRDILPILSENCFACHGPDAPTRKAGLRLDRSEGTTQPLPSGDSAIVPGNPQASTLIQRITTHDTEEQMPPPETGKTLSEHERALLTRWIAEGAVWQPHWAFLPPTKSPLPDISNGSWPRNPIDQFVLARLAKEELAPTPEANRYTLIRRVSLALTGIAPSPEEIDCFVQDSDPLAYEALVDRLLASPRYGEHQARHWLDLARYADTNGYAADIQRTMWRYRDWVIGAFNANMPFDQFTIEQLAGDLLPDPSLDQRIATGFNRNHPIMMEGGAIFEEYRVGNVIDRVDTTATTWLGLSMKCAQCHDHKYDPITQREYYQFFAFFNSISEEESKLFGTELDGNSLPRIKAPLPTQQADKARIEKSLSALRVDMLRPNTDVDQQQEAWETQERGAISARWTALDGALLPPTSDDLNEDDTLVLSTTTDLEEITALRLDVDLTKVGVSRFSLVALELVIAPPVGATEETSVKFAESAATNDGEKRAYDGNADTAWHLDGDGQHISAVFSFATPVGFSDGTRVRVVLRGPGIADSLERIHLAVTNDPTYLPATLSPWRINGPYVAVNGDSALDTEHVNPKAIELAAVDDEGQGIWRTQPEDFPDGKTHTLTGKTCATYFHRIITAPSSRRMDIALNNRNAVKLWVNGRLALDKGAQGGEVGAHPAPVTIELHAGENAIVIKAVDYYDFNAHTFYFARTGEDVGYLPLEVEKALLRKSTKRSEAQAGAVRAFYRSHYWEGWAPRHERELDRAWELAQLDQEIPTTMVMEELPTPRSTHVLIRGQYDQPGEKVSPGIPAALHGWPKGAPRNRLGLAQWLVSPDNPLTARVVVNRYWQRYFGVGLVRTADDFGVQGTWPTHPELLDWLARAFIDSGWDVKALQRLLVTSATFRQASHLRPDEVRRNPANRLLAHGPRFRLDAEQLRDNALAASGLLVEALGGPSVRPYQPPGLWKDVAYGGGGLRYTAQEFFQDHGEKLYRRSLYTFWKRAAAPPGMLLFDAPNRDVCTARRSRSNTPLQALVLMNDVQYIEAARALACRIMKESGPDARTRIAHACMLALGRPPRPAEKATLRRQFEAQWADYRAMPDSARALLDTGESDYETKLDPAELAAWTMVASALMNTDASVTQY